MGASEGSYMGYKPGSNLNMDSDRAVLELRLGPQKTPSKKTGVVYNPLANFVYPGPNIPKPPAPSTQPVLPPVVQNIRDLYAGLASQLEQTRASEAARINESTGNTIRALQSINPLAGYRETIPILYAPEAASTSYLNAIGANPAQVQAQQALTNQMIGSQSASQSAFAQAMDQYANDYRNAQQANVYTNQAQALANLGYATQAQQTGLQMARMQQEQELRKILLEYQLNLAKKAMSTGGAMANPGLMQEALQNASSVLF